MQEKIALSWSGGKDACLALHYLSKSQKYEIDHLHTIIGKETDRVGMHGIRKPLIELQAKALGIPLKISYLPSDSDNTSYEQLMLKYAEFCKSKEVKTLAFGDIFLEDLKKYREDQMQSMGIKCIFPLWKKPTLEVIHEFLDLGYQTLICAADASKISKEIVGETITHELIRDLPHDIDPCGENGEFHTFVYKGPLFTKQIKVSVGEVKSHFYDYQIEEEGKTKKMKSEFYFADIE